MLSISPAVRIFVHALPTDMRKSFDGLYAIVQHAFAKDVFQGDYFVFLNQQFPVGKKPRKKGPLATLAVRDLKG